MKHYLDAAENAARAAGKLLCENFQRLQRVKVFASGMDDFAMEFLNIAERNFT